MLKKRRQAMKLFPTCFLFICGLCLPTYAQEITAPETPATEMPSPEINTSDVNETQTENPAAESENPPEPEVIYAEEEVFSAEFMKNLITCSTDTESQNDRTVEIAGPQNGYCLLQYANFDLHVPLTLLGNIHGFDDIEKLLKNKDIAHYNYRADYIYDGLMYALNACFNKKNYEGKQEELADEYVTIERGLYADFINDTCSVYLSNTQNIEGVITDYGVTCTLPYKTVQDLEPYFKDLAEKYGEKRGFAADGHIMITREQKNKHTKDADIALMYYLQKNGYCKKNAE